MRVAHATATEAAPAVRLMQFITVFCIGGTERRLFNLTHGIDRTRFDLHVGCFHRSGPLLREFEEDQVRITEFEIRKLFTPASARQQFRLASYLKSNDIQILHSNGFYPNLFALSTAALAGTPVRIASVSDLEHHLSGPRKLLQRWICRTAHCIVVNAEAVRDHLMAAGYPKEKIAVIHNGIDLSRYANARPRGMVRREFGLPERVPLVAVIARLSPVKGVEYFLEAAAAVGRKFPEARFLVVGDHDGHTDYRALLMRKVRELGLADRIIFTGFRMDVSDILPDITVSVLPSFSEGLSNVLIESQAAGVPVVASRVGGNPEVVEDGVSGLLVPPADSAALGNAISELLSHPDCAERFGRAGRRRAMEKFSLHRMVRETEELYRSLLARDPHASSAAPLKN